MKGEPKRPFFLPTVGDAFTSPDSDLLLVTRVVYDPGPFDTARWRVEWMASGEPQFGHTYFQRNDRPRSQFGWCFQAGLLGAERG